MHLITYAPMGINDICLPCEKWDKCLERIEGQGENWLFHDQLELCVSQGEPTYVQDDDLIIAACCASGPMAVPLTPEEEALLLTMKTVVFEV